MDLGVGVPASKDCLRSTRNKGGGGEAEPKVGFNASPRKKKKSTWTGREKMVWRGELSHGSFFRGLWGDKRRQESPKRSKFGAWGTAARLQPVRVRGGGSLRKRNLGKERTKGLKNCSDEKKKAKSGQG